MDDLAWLNGLHPVVRALILTVSGLGGLGAIGVILDKLLPSAKERLEEARLRRVEDRAEDNETISHLEQLVTRLEARNRELEREADEAKTKVYAEREARITEKQQAATTMIELELLRSKLGMANVILPEDVAEDRAALPPGEPHDDREGAE